MLLCREDPTCSETPQQSLLIPTVSKKEGSLQSEQHDTIHTFLSLSLALVLCSFFLCSPYCLVLVVVSLSDFLDNCVLQSHCLSLLVLQLFCFVDLLCCTFQLLSGFGVRGGER